MRFVVLVLIFVAIFSLISAQTSDDFDAWEFVEDCVPEPTASPVDWRFDGVVMLTGEFGVHVIDSDITTPYVVAFLRDVVPGGGGLSPDGNWYATLRGAQNTQAEGNVWDVFQLRLYSLRASRTDVVLPLVQSYSSGLNLQNHSEMHWLDDSRIVFDASEVVDDASEVMAVIYDVSTGAESRWEREVNPLLNATHFFPAPDWERAILNTAQGVFDPSEWQIVEIESGDVIAEPDLADFIEPVWSPDSSRFVAEIEQETEDDYVYDVAMFNADGDASDILMTLEAGERMLTAFESDVRHVRWSDDGRYVAFVTTTLSFPTNITLYIADTETRTVTDTCIYTENGIAWSPDGTQIALFPRLVYEPRQELLIFDLENWAQYGVRRFHEGNVIGWRE
ncbi:MAG: hypothetical protein RLP44_21200 [Aggregatilineales bacterium]